MRSKAFIGNGFAIAALALTACGSSDGGGSAASSTPSKMSSDKAMSSSAPMSSGMSSGKSMMADAMGHGTFKGLNGKHVAGKVTVEGHTVKLSGFSSDEGPDLHLYLANGTDEAAVGKGKELGKVSFDKATQTFDLRDVQASGFTDLVVHCDKAKAVFGAAALSS